MSKTLRDREGDTWEYKGGLYECTSQLMMKRSLEELECDYGPLTVVEEECTCPTVPGLDGEPIPAPSPETVCSYCMDEWEKANPTLSPVEEDKPVNPFAGMRALADALSKPLEQGYLLDQFVEDAVNKFTAVVPTEVADKARSSSGDAFPEDAFSVYDEAFNILLKKNADYGPSNIADSPGGPLNGILVRMWDKMSRLRHLVESGATPENESLRDTLMDMANYSLIAMIVLDGNWPGMKEDK